MARVDFPKSHNISIAIDKAAGAEREVVGTDKRSNKEGAAYDRRPHREGKKYVTEEYDITTPSTEHAKTWNGYGTALKPAHEPICVAMKPLAGTYAENAIEHGVAGINVDGCRVSYESEADKEKALAGDAFKRKDTSDKGWSRPWMEDQVKVDKINKEAKERAQNGRWPANIILSYPEDSYKLRNDVTPEELRELAEWMDENPEL